jgi:dipeptidyl aminopeptidase/acylaminoacyl peptidase
MRFRISISAVSVWLALSTVAFADSDVIVTTDLLKIKQLSSVQFSPDGRSVVYVVKSIELAKPGELEEKKKEDKEDQKLEKYSYQTQIYLAPIDGSSAPRQITYGDKGATAPSWSPNGREIAFVRTVEDKPQIFILPLEGGEAWQLTFVKEGASRPRWSPDGKRILFESDVPHHLIGKEMSAKEKKVPEWPEERPGRTPGDVANWGDKDAEKPKADPDGNLQEIREWLERNAASSNPRVLNRLDIEGETDLQSELSYTHVYVIAVKAESKPSAVTTGYYSFGGAEWLPDGRIILAGSMDATQHPDRVLDSDLFIFNADGTNLKTLLDLKDYSVFNPTVSPDGSSIAFQFTDQKDLGYSLTKVGTISVSGGDASLLTKDFDRDVEDQKWSKDGRWLYFTCPSNGGFPLHRIPSKGGNVERLTDFTSGIRDFDISKTAVVYVLTEVKDPYELYTTLLNATKAKRLSNHNSEWLTTKKLSFPEAHQLKRSDGVVVDYWIMRPTQFETGKRYPLLVEIHGGPAAMWGPGEDTTWHEFQFFTARGFGIVYSNPRGSGGYGHDFQKMNYQNWGEGPSEDVLAAATEAVKESWVDHERQVLTGGSYAGYLTAWIVAHDNRFKAAAAQRGVYELTTFLGEGNAWRLVPEHFGGYPWNEEARAVLLRESPLTYADKIQTPLLIKHGDNDLRTGTVQSEMLYKSLKILGKPVEYLRYPGASHELSRSGDPLQRMDRLLRLLEFMERYVG